jgi:nicotinate-nucleotide adenylyltransferase
MRIGFFGGSFDPPHRGHLSVATAAAQAFALDTVLFVPTSHQPLKPHGPSAPYADRLAMVELLCAEAPPSLHCTASTLEAPLPGDAPHYTVDTLLRLRSTLDPADALFVLAGADAFLQLPHWRSPALLLQLADWIVLSRPGFDTARLTHMLDTLLPSLGLPPATLSRIHLLQNLADPTSATALRNDLAMAATAPSAATAAVDGLPPTILAYIQSHHLYGL